MVVKISQVVQYWIWATPERRAPSNRGGRAYSSLCSRLKLANINTYRRRRPPTEEKVPRHLVVTSSSLSGFQNSFTVWDPRRCMVIFCYRLKWSQHTMKGAIDRLIKRLSILIKDHDRRAEFVSTTDVHIQCLLWLLTETGTKIKRHFVKLIAILIQYGSAKLMQRMSKYVDF